MKTIELSIEDRLLLTFTLPTMGTRIEMLLVRDLVRKIEFAPSEIEAFEIKDLPDNSGITYKKGATHLIGIEVTADQLSILDECINEAGRRKVVTLAVLDLADRIELLRSEEIPKELPEVTSSIPEVSE